MSELIERYVHRVGRYLPGKERAEIEAELRSQIQDQLEDRYEGAGRSPIAFALNRPRSLTHRNAPEKARTCRR